VLFFIVLSISCLLGSMYIATRASRFRGWLPRLRNRGLTRRHPCPPRHPGGLPRPTKVLSDKPAAHLGKTCGAGGENSAARRAMRQNTPCRRTHAITPTNQLVIRGSTRPVVGHVMASLIAPPRRGLGAGCALLRGGRPRKPSSVRNSLASLITPSLEARQPLLAAFADGLPGSLPPTQRGLALARPGAMVTAFGPNPDGEGVVLRLWEYAGRSGPCRVELPNGLPAGIAQPVDLRGRPSGPPVRIGRGHFDSMVHAFEPVSYVVNWAKGPG
jgi:hypothetical protein